MTNTMIRYKTNSDNGIQKVERTQDYETLTNGGFLLVLYLEVSIFRTRKHYEGT
jgi:hypothetical protein